MAEDVGPWTDYKAAAPAESGPWNDYAKQDPPPSDAFLSRVADGVKQTAIVTAAAAKGAAVGAYDAVTEGNQLGVDNFAPETKKWLTDNGFILDHGKPLPGGIMGGIRFVNDQINRTFMQGLDVINRAFSVPGAAVGGGTKEALKALGLPDAEAEKQGAAAEEFTNLAAIFSGADGANMHITRTGPTGEVRDIPLTQVRLPQASDFKQAADSVVGGDAPPHVQSNLIELYHHQGIHPVEAAVDASDPEIRQSLLSKGKDVPAAYGGDRALDLAEARAKAAGGDFGGGGNEPPRLTGPAEPGSYEDAKAKILDQLSIGENPKIGASSYVDEAVRGFVDRLYPIQRALDEGGLDLATIDNPYRLARLFSGIGGKIDTVLNRYTIDFDTHDQAGPGLKQVLAPVKDQLDDFRVFLVAARSLELEKRGVETGIDHDAAMTIGAHRTKLFEDTAKKLYDFQNQVALYGKKSGLLSDKGYKEMLEANKVYVPFHALMDVDNRGIPGISPSNLRTQQPFKKIKGSERVKIDPLESIIKNTFTVMANADKNVIGTKLIDALLQMKGKAKGSDLITMAQQPRDLDAHVNEAIREAEGGALGTMGRMKAEPSQLTNLVKNNYIDQKPGELSIFRNGRRETYLIDPELAEAFHSLDAPNAGFFTRFVGMFASTLRAGAVLSPDFFLRHMLRDYAYAFSTYKGESSFSPVDMGRGLASMIVGTFTKNENHPFVQWMRDGGGQVAMVSLDRDYLQMNLEKLTADTGLMTRAWNVVRHPLHPLQVANEWATSASHLGAYIKKQGELGDGGLSKAQKLDAAFASRDTAVDVARMGAKTRAYNQISAFLNVKVQDTYRVGEAIYKDPKTLLKFGMAITAPSILLWAANRDNQRVQDLPRWERDMFWIIPIDHWTDGDPEQIKQGVTLGRLKSDEVREVNGRMQYNDQVLIRVPKPFSAGMVFGTLTERLLDEFAAEKPDAMKGFLGSLGEQTVGDLIPNAFVPPYEQATNRSMMSGRNIVPGNMEDLLPEYQYTPYTTELAKALGKLFGELPGAHTLALQNEGGFVMSTLEGGARAMQSPIQIENYIRGWTGSLGMYAFKLLDKAGVAVGALPDQVHAPGTLADVPFVKAFIARYPGSSQAVQDFYDRYAEVKPYQATLKELQKSASIADMERVRAMGGDEAFIKLDGIKQSIGRQYNFIRAIDGAPEKLIPRDQKRQIIDNLFYRIVLTAKAGTELGDSIKKEMR